MPDTAQNAVVDTSLFNTLYIKRLNQNHEELFDFLTIEINDNTFEMYAPNWRQNLWPEQDAYSPTICHEPPVSKSFINEISKNDVVWDLGSRYGYYGCIAAQVNNRPENVHMFELGEVNTCISRILNKKQFDGGMNIMQKKISDTTSQESVSVDEYIRKTAPPDVIKMDIEGSEAPVLNGLQRTIMEHKPTMVIEMHPNKIYQHFNSNDEALLMKLNDWYSEVLVCERWRNATGSWSDDWQSVVQSVHQLSVKSQTYFADRDNHVGYIDPDSYAVLVKDDS